MDEPGSPFKHAHFNKGNTLVILGRFVEAASCYREAVQAGGGNASAPRNLESLNKVTNYMAAGRVVRIVTEPEPSTKLPVKCVKIICSGVEKNSEPISFKGNVGNKGNTGGAGLSGGQGFGGGPDFVVRICKDSG